MPSADQYVLLLKKERVNMAAEPIYRIEIVRRIAIGRKAYDVRIQFD